MSLRYAPIPYAAYALVARRPAAAGLLAWLYRDAHQAGWTWLRFAVRELADDHDLKKHVVESLLDDLVDAGLAEREVVLRGNRQDGTRFRLLDPALLEWAEEEDRAVRTPQPRANRPNAREPGHERTAERRADRPDTDRTRTRTREAPANAEPEPVHGHHAGHGPDTYDLPTDRPDRSIHPPNPPAEQGGSVRAARVLAEGNEREQQLVAWVADRAVRELEGLEERGDEDLLAEYARQVETANARMVLIWFLGTNPRRRGGRRATDLGVPLESVQQLQRLYRDAPHGLTQGVIAAGLRVAGERWRARARDPTANRDPPTPPPLDREPLTPTTPRSPWAPSGSS